MTTSIAMQIKLRTPSIVAKLLFTALFAALVTGCSSKGDKDLFPENLSESQLYQISEDAIDKQHYSDAIKALRAMESRYPFGALAKQSQLDIIYAYYKNAEPEASKAASDRFIRLHPNHPDVDYAYYMKGLASNTATMGLLDRYLPVDLSRRDPGQSKLSFNEFSDLLTKFPNSKYVPDARQRMIALRNRLAQYEIHAAKYYLKRKAFVAAANRGKYVIENMQGTPSVAEALAIMIESYQHLGLTSSAKDALAVLKLNYPDHPSLNEDGDFVGYKVFDDVNPSIWSTLTFGLIGGRPSEPETLQAPRSQPEQEKK